MRQTILCAILSLALIPALNGQFHTPVFPSLDGTALADSVVQKFKPTNVLNYNKARDTMYSKIDKIDGKVTCIYSGYSIELPENVDPSFYLYNSSYPISAEHIFPRSKGADEDSGNAFSDLHHLFPALQDVNVGRSNFPFQEIPDSETTKWYYQINELSMLPNSNIDLYSERITGAFEPAEMQKGNIARAMFYFYMMYQELADEADPDFFESQRETICDWHLQDPVDENEWNRTYKISQYQDGKPNPYVLDCSLALRTFCPHLVSNCNELSAATDVQQAISSLTVYPNPARDYINIRINFSTRSDTKVNVYSGIGRLIHAETLQQSGIGESTFPLSIKGNGFVILEVVAGNQIWREKVLIWK